MSSRFISKLILIYLTIFISINIYAIKLNITLQDSAAADSDTIANLYKQLEIEKLVKDDYQEWQAKYHIKNIEKEIKSQFETLGYYNVQVNKIVDKNDISWNIKYNIHKGPATIITSSDINITGPGKYNPDIRKIVKSSELKTGTIINYKTYDDFKNSLYATAENQGYFDAKFTKSNIYINRVLNTAKININFDTKIKFKFGNIKFIQQQYNRVSEKFLYKFLTFKANQKYSYQKILNLQTGLSKYFDKVMIIPTPNQKTKTVDIRIDLHPLTKYKYKLGAGYSTDDGFNILASRKVLYINNYGHSYEASAKVGQYNDYVNLIYYSPGEKPATDQISFGYNYLDEKKQNEKYIEKTRHEVFGNYQRQYDQYNSKIIGGLKYNIENYTTTEEGINIHSRLLTPEFSWYKLYNNKDKFGFIFNFNTLGSINDLLSTISLSKTSIYSKVLFYITPNFKTTVRGQVGQIWNKDNDISQVPPTMRFYAGGTDSVRGYQYKSIAPRYTNSKGEEFIIGGSKLLVGSLEFAYRVYGPWFAAVFTDAGNADETWKLVHNNMSKSIGVGAHYQSPIGNITIDVARAISKRDKPWRLSLNIGPEL